VQRQLFLDSSLRIINVNPYFTLHVDSVLQYQFEINRAPSDYYWYLTTAPVGVRLDRRNGTLFFKAEKSFFKSGKLKYDQEYKVAFGVRNLHNPADYVDTVCTIVFYNTEIVAPKVKPTVNQTLNVEEGDSIRFRIQCEEGSFPIENITLLTNIPISGYTQVKKCDDEFWWFVPYDFIREGDTTRQRQLLLSFVGTDKFFNKDTATVRVFVRPGINFPEEAALHQRTSDEIRLYINNLKVAFLDLSRKVKKNKNTRTSFDISGSTTALAGTVLATAGSTESAQDIGKILPSVGLTLVPVKEAVAPTRIQEQNMATQVRTVAKRLEYMISENQLTGPRDPYVLSKTKKLQDELKQARLQLVDVPVDMPDPKTSQKEANNFFDDPKVNKKYKPKM
jgi:hypothetical protein